MKKNLLLDKQFAPLRTKLSEQRDAILAESAPLHKRRDKLVAKIQPLELELQEVNELIAKVEQPLQEIGNSLAGIARAVGAVSLEAGPETK